MKSINTKYHQFKSSINGGFFTLSLKKLLISSVCILLFASTIVYGQSKNKKVAKIEILNANTLEFEEKNSENVKRLIGNVQLKHDDALMFCDSAYIFSTSNTMDAYGNVRITQGDSLQLFGDSLKYNGNTKMAILRGDIKLINNDVILTTNHLDYNRNDNIAYYFGGGKMVNNKENNTLTSEQGYYHASAESFYFKENVLLVNPDYTIEADTLNYISSSEVVNFLGPTTITSDDNFIYTEKGWYNTQNNKSKFYKNAYLYSEKKIISGDTLYYDRKSGFGEIACNGIINDTIEDIIIEGDVVHLYEKNDSAMVTQEALMLQLFKEDTLYMHADTFKISSKLIQKGGIDTTNGATKYIDSVWTDTVKTLYAYNHAKFYKKDMQGKADSIIYNFSDSTINFYQQPIIWSEQNQITADFIYLLITDNKIDKMYMNENAFIISKVDSLSEKYNQIKGKNMIGYFHKNKLKKIDVMQNSETIYYPLDDDGKYIGVNRLTGSNMLVLLKNNKIKTITFIKTPEGVLNPLQEILPKNTLLKGFNWRISEQPKNQCDIFIN